MTKRTHEEVLALLTEQEDHDRLQYNRNKYRNLPITTEQKIAVAKYNFLKNNPDKTEYTRRITKKEKAIQQMTPEEIELRKSFIHKKTNKERLSIDERRASAKYNFLLDGGTVEEFNAKWEKKIKDKERNAKESTAYHFMTQREVDAYRNFLESKRVGRQPTEEERNGYTVYHRIYKRIKRGKHPNKIVQEPMLFELIRVYSHDVYDKMTSHEVEAYRSYKRKVRRIQKGGIETITDEERDAERTYQRIKSHTERGKASRDKWRKTDSGQAYLSDNKERNKSYVKEIWDDFDGRCVYSGVKLKTGGRGMGYATSDHLIPELRYNKKDDDLRNVVLASWTTNSAKNNMSLYEFYANNAKRLKLRPLKDILADLERLGKFIPPPDIYKEEAHAQST